MSRSPPVCENAHGLMHPTLRALLDRNLIVCVGPLVTQTADLAGPRQLVDVCRGALGPKHEGLAELWAQPALRGVGRLLARAEELMGSARFVRLVQPHLDRDDARPSLVARAWPPWRPRSHASARPTWTPRSSGSSSISGVRSRRSRRTSRRAPPSS